MPFRSLGTEDSESAISYFRATWADLKRHGYFLLTRKLLNRKSRMLDFKLISTQGFYSFLA